MHSLLHFQDTCEVPISDSGSLALNNDRRICISLTTLGSKTTGSFGIPINLWLFRLITVLIFVVVERYSASKRAWLSHIGSGHNIKRTEDSQSVEAQKLLVGGKLTLQPKQECMLE